MSSKRGVAAERAAPRFPGRRWSEASRVRPRPRPRRSAILRLSFSIRRTGTDFTTQSCEGSARQCTRHASGGERETCRILPVSAAAGAAARCAAGQRPGPERGAGGTRGSRVTRPPHNTVVHGCREAPHAPRPGRGLASEETQTRVPAWSPLVRTRADGSWGL